MAELEGVVEHCEHCDGEHKHATEEELIQLNTLLGILGSGMDDVAGIHRAVDLSTGPDEQREALIDAFNSAIYSVWSVARTFVDAYEGAYGMDEEEVAKAKEDVMSVVNEALRLGMVD